MASDKPIEIDVTDLKRRKFVLSGASILALIVGLTLGHSQLAEHLDVHVMSEAEGQVLTQQVQQAADAAQKAAESADRVAKSLEQHIQREDLKEARAKLAVLKEQLSGTQLWESSNGANEISRARKAELAAQIEETERVISTLERRDYVVR